jgi:Rad3-related DNA helicase
MSENNNISISELIANFPFGRIRPKQLNVLQQIGEAINSGYKFLVLEAPTGFGKSPVAVALGRTLGTSYICSATKELQTQYRDGQQGWLHLINITRPEAIEKRSEFMPCPYYDQLNKGMLASHSIFNYANFLIFINANMIKPRKLLVLDEGHQIENQLVEKIGFSISKRSLQKYLATNLLEYTNYSYNDDIQTTWLKLLDRICSELKEAIPNIGTNEAKLDAKQYLNRLEDAIAAIRIDPKNWIVSEIVHENNEIDVVTPHSTRSKRVLKVAFKPLNIAPYCETLFGQGDTTLIMSATILDFDTFCKNVGLDRNMVKFIEVGSDFPVANRPVYKLNTAYLNYNSLQIESIQCRLVNAIDKIMGRHADDKGIIHTTSYAQVRFIERFLSTKNRIRLISTDSEVPREEIIAKHWLESNKRSVLISPSLHTGLDLKDSQSRFQIIVKIPYPSRADRWIEAKRKQDGGRWYNWQTALKLVQACGRSIRSVDDWAKTYVLDSAFDRLIGENKLPGWFRESINDMNINDWTI